MVKSVYVPEAGGLVQFPDEATPQQMLSFIESNYGGIAAAAPQTAPTGPDESSLLGRAAYGFATGFTDIPGGIAALMYPAEEAAKTSAGEFSNEARKYLQETFGIDPTKDPTAAQQAAEALGSVGSFLVPGSAAVKGASLLGKGAAAAARLGSLTAAAQGVALGASGRSQKIQQQLDEGMQISPEQQLAAQRLDGFIGASEAIPINKFFGPLTTLLSKVPVSKASMVEKIIESRLANIGRAGLEEGAQEVASGVASDLVEKGVYNPDVQIGQDILSNAGTGAFAGSFVEGVIQLAAGRKLRPYKQLSEDLAKEQSINSVAMRQGQIALGAEDLRNFNVEGDVEIVEEEIDGLPRFTIKTGAGNSVGQFLDPSEAEEAVDIYKQRTGAKITVRKPEDLPSVYPVKIGGEEFNSTDEIIAARDGLVSKAEGLASYMSRPEILKREAARQNASEALVKEAVDKEVGDLNTKISKLNEFISKAKPTPTEIEPEGVRAAVLRGAPARPAPITAAQETIAPVEELAAPEEVVAAQPEPLAAPEAVTAIEEEPIGAVTPEIPVEEARYIEEAPAVSGPAEIEPPTRKEMRPSATDEQLTALKIELFGEPKGYRDMTPEELSVYEAERDKRYPPMEVDLYSAGPVKEARPVRRTLSQAEAEGPIVRDYTTETKQRYQDIYTALKSRLSGRVPKDVDVKLEELISADKNILIRGQARAEKTPNGIKSIVDLSTGVLRPDMTVEQAVKELAETLDHEIIHVLRNQGVLRPAEWAVLSKAVTSTKVPGKAYTYLDKAQAVYTPAGQPIAPIYASPDAVVEEAVAEMYKDWVKNQTAPVQTRGLFNRITEFFRSIFRVLKSTRYEEVFKDIEAGKVGAREGEGRDIETRLSAGPVTPAATQRGNELDVVPMPEDNIGSSSTYLRASHSPIKLSGKVNQEELGKAFDRAFKAKFGVQHDITNPTNYQQIVDSIVDEVKLQMKQAQSGVGWYDSDIQLVFDELSKSFPILKDPYEGAPYRRLFTLIAGVMSNGMKAKANVEFAAMNFAHFMNNGVFSPNNPFTGIGWNQRSNIMGPQIAMLNSMINDPRFAPRDGSNNPRTERVENFLEFMFSPHTVKEINSFRAAHGTKSPAKIGTVNDKRLGAYAFGPKFGPFILNLNGLTDETVDSWASRSFYRHMGRSVGANGKLNDAPLGPAHREAMKRALRDIAARTNLSSRDVQAVLWFYEKELYNHLGKNIPLEVFSDGAKEFNRRYGTGTTRPSESRTDRERAIIGAVGDAGARYDQTPERGAGQVRFSAAPLPPYVEAKNRTLFRPEPKVPFHKQMFDFFLGHPTAPKTIRTIHGDIELSAKDRFLLSARVGAVDNTAYVEHLEKLLNERDTGSFQRRDADFSATAALAWNRRSSQLAASVIMMGKPEIKFARPGDIQSATIAAENDPDSLLNVFRIMLEPGPVDSVTGETKDKREVFRAYATAMRAIGLKAAGLPVPRELDDTYINTTIPFTQQNYPEVVEAYRMYQRFNKNLLTAARDAGVITTASLANLTRKMDYYGFYREVYQEELTPNIPSKTAGEFDLREYKGSQYGNLIDDPMFVIVQNTQFWMSAISRNLASTKTFELAKNMGEARLLGASEKPDPARGESSDVMFFRKDGVTKRFAVSDPLLVSALGSDDRADIGAAMKVLGYPTKIIRESVTRDPAFMITNLIRDTLSSWITSGEDFTPFIGTAKGFAKALKGTASYEALMGRGVVGSHDLAMQGPGELAATLRRRLNPPNVHSITSVKGATDVLGTLWDRLGVWSEASDAATRIAVYEAAKAQGMSEAEATFRAIQILDFSRKGGSVTLNLLTKLIPFLNARIQGLDVLYQAGMAGQRYLRGQSRGENDANLGKKFLVRGTILAAVSLALEMMNEDDEDYKDLPDYLKKSNLLIPLKGFGLDGQFLAIAKPFEAGLLFSTMPQQFYKTMAGDISTRENVGFFVESFASTLGVNPIPQILMPALEVIVNHDFYTGLPLISEGKARLAPELQYDSRTSTLARMLGDIPIKYNFTTGKFEGVSPIVIDQLIGGYSGPIGTMIAQGVGYGIEMADQGPERLPRDLTAHPIIRRFFVDAESRSPKTVAQAYELFRIVDEANRSFSRLRQTGDAEAAMRYLEENKDALSYKKYVFKLVDRLNKLSAYERQVERDKDMTQEEKAEAVKKIREVRKNLTSKIGEINKALGR